MQLDLQYLNVQNKLLFNKQDTFVLGMTKCQINTID